MKDKATYAGILSSCSLFLHIYTLYSWYSELKSLKNQKSFLSITSTSTSTTARVSPQTLEIGCDDNLMMKHVRKKILN